jgi:nucleoside 2-deoxyribosyltransferase
MKNRKIKVYLAGGWFDEFQESALSKLEDILFNMFSDKFDTYSPRKEIVLEGHEGINVQDLVFNENCKHIKEADLVIASTVGKDMGTIWETGFAYANSIPIVYTLFDSRILNAKFNLMLAASGIAAFTSLEDFINFIDEIDINNLNNISKRYNGEVE